MVSSYRTLIIIKVHFYAIKTARIIMNKPNHAVSKGLVLIRHVTNWPLLIKDKVFGGSNILYKFRSGETVECRAKSTDVNEAVVVLSGIEYPEQFCRLRTKHKPIIFDIGANIGSFSIYAHRLNQKSKPIIYAFEPHPENANLTQANFKRNRISNYQIITKAVAGTDGTALFDISGAFDSFKLNSQANETIEVETTKLSTFCSQQSINRIDLLKMDIEGGEYEVINYDIDFIKNNVSVLLIEYHNFDIEDGQHILIEALKTEFSINIQNPHKDGGMLIAVNKTLAL